MINTTPWMEALEAQLGALGVVEKLLHVDSPRVHKELHSGWQVDKRILQTAAPFAWSSEATRAVLEASKSIPLDTGMTRWNLETPTVFWRFETPLPFQTITTRDNIVGVRALGFGWIKTVSAFGMPCHTWLDDPMGEWPLIPSQTWEWSEGDTLGSMLEATRKHYQRVYGPGGMWEKRAQVGVDIFMAATEGISRFVLAGLAWLNQRVLVAEAAHVERHRRKDFNRRTGQALEAIKVVQLRKNEYPPREHGESEVEWSCRWAVIGHWRNQACGPKHGDHQLRYIMPFVKGPSDKPFREAPRKVYEVSR